MEALGLVEIQEGYHAVLGETGVRDTTAGDWRWSHSGISDSLQEICIVVSVVVTEKGNECVQWCDHGAHGIWG